MRGTFVRIAVPDEDQHNCLTLADANGTANLHIAVPVRCADGLIYIRADIFG